MFLSETSFKNRYKIFTAVFTAAILLLVTTSAFAAPPGTRYAPGETLNPTCAPTDTNCGVDQIYVNPTTLQYGIGTSTPYSKLTLWGAGTTTGKTFEIANSASTTLFSLLDSGLAYFLGNVGIGTTSPAYKLDVNGDINVAAGSAYKLNGANVIRAQTALNNYFFGAAGNLTMTGSFNTAEGLSALSSNTTSSYNTANGAYALFSNTSAGGGDNSAFGAYSLYSNTTGTFNSAFGANALYSNDGGAENTAVGRDALFYNTGGSGNSAVGRKALFSNTGGLYNSANGYQSLYSNTTGSYNSAVGENALNINGTGSYNVALGGHALWASFNTSNNSAVGYQALYNSRSSNNAALGYSAGYGSTIYNNQGGVYLGYQSGYSAASGSDFNTLVGYQSGYGVTTGSNNIWLGSATSSTAVANLTTGSQNILIGNNISLPSATASGQLNIGNIIYGTGITGTGSTLSAGNIGIGTTTPAQALSVNGKVYSTGGFQFGDGTLQTTAAIAATNYWTLNGNNIYNNNNSGLGNVGIGTATPATRLDITNSATSSAAITLRDPLGNIALELRAGTSTLLNTFVGYQSGFSNKTGNENTATGYQSLYSFAAGSWNTANGNQALYSMVSGSRNTATGYQALYKNTADQNVANGSFALWNNTTGTFNTASGDTALYANTTGSNNTAYGYSSLGNNTTGIQNTAVGASAFNANTMGTSSVAVGYRAGASNTIGYQNTFLGVSAGETDGTITTPNNLFNATAIGYNAQVTASNSLILGGMGTWAVKVGIGTTTPASTFTTVGSACVSKGTGATALCSTTAGTITANVFNTAAADLAERYNTDDPTLGAGEITMLDPGKSLSVMRASRVKDATVFGVVSTNPGFLLGSYNTTNEASTSVPVALSGRVPVKVTNEGGPIQIGDKITLSSTPGAAMKATSTKAVIGTALQNFTDTQGTILAFVDTLGVKQNPTPSEDTMNLKAIAGLTTPPSLSSTDSFTTMFFKNIFTKVGTWLADAKNGITDFFANRVHTKELCVAKSDGTEVCVSGDQLGSLLGAKGITVSTSTTTITTSTPLTISIQGNNPATIKVGDRYGDLGATITAPTSALNLGIKASVDGGSPIDMSNISIDTKTAGIHHIVYTVVDQTSATTTAERILNVVLPVTVTATTTVATSTPVATVATTTTTSATH